MIFIINKFNSSLFLNLKTISLSLKNKENKKYEKNVNAT